MQTIADDYSVSPEAQSIITNMMTVASQGLLASKDDLPLISVTTHDVKIAVFGESGCGKSELISRITKVNGNHGDETRGIVVSSLYYPIRLKTTKKLELFHYSIYDCGYRSCTNIPHYDDIMRQDALVLIYVLNLLKYSSFTTIEGHSKSAKALPNDRKPVNILLSVGHERWLESEVSLREIDKYCNDNGCIHIPLKKMEYVPGDEHVTTLTHDMEILNLLDRITDSLLTSTSTSVPQSARQS